MTNGSNDWGVAFSLISWLQRFLQNHTNLTDISRERDILFTVHRKRQDDIVNILCCDEYTMGLTLVHRGLAEFERINIFYVGGGWNGYTRQAKEYCIQNNLGLFVTDEMTGALWRNDYWNYHRKDEKGNPLYHYRAA